jgi:hypothetical protein
MYVNTDNQPRWLKLIKIIKCLKISKVLVVYCLYLSGTIPLTGIFLVSSPQLEIIVFVF